MQLHLEGSEVLSLPRPRVFQLLTDTAFLAKSLPDTEEAKVIDGDNLDAKMKIRIAFITAHMAVKMNLQNKAPPQHARLHVEGAGSGSNMKIDSDFDLEGDAVTTMKWVADAEITGVMAGIGSSVLKGFAEKKVKEIFEGIKDAMVRAGPETGQM